ncbi:MAG: hypothetical protein QM652_09340 [Legionella sp.]|uniref:hypothetical protein n=1 Tax=Legionella sp. TaxID=459 RepID=UPI0039E3BA96
MTTTIFLATVLGWYFVIMALFLFFRRDLVIATMNELMEQPGLLFVAAVITLIMGLLMVISHNVWVMKWPVVVTIIAWLTLIGGLVRLFCPETVHRVWGKIVGNSRAITIAAIVTLIVGLYLLAKVYLKSVL